MANITALTVEEESFSVFLNGERQNSGWMKGKEVLRLANGLNVSAEDEIVFLNELGEDFTISDIEYLVRL